MFLFLLSRFTTQYILQNLAEIDRIRDFKHIRYSTDIYSEFTVTFIMCLEIPNANQHHP